MRKYNFRWLSKYRQMLRRIFFYVDKIDLWKPGLSSCIISKLRTEESNWANCSWIDMDLIESCMFDWKQLSHDFVSSSSYCIKLYVRNGINDLLIWLNSLFLAWIRSLPEVVHEARVPKSVLQCRAWVNKCLNANKVECV